MTATDEMFLAFSVKVMETTRAQIQRCLGQLSEEQIWRHHSAHENSVVNLLLHVEGNLRQWILHGIDQQPDVRKRDVEFAARAGSDGFSAAAVQSRLYETMTECQHVIAALAPERLTEMIDPQPGSVWGEPTILEGIYLVVNHLQMHAGQIILLTKQMVGHDLGLTTAPKR